MAADTKKIPVIKANPSTIGQFDIFSNKTKKYTDTWLEVKVR